MSAWRRTMQQVGHNAVSSIYGACIAPLCAWHGLTAAAIVTAVLAGINAALVAIVYYQERGA